MHRAGKSTSVHGHDGCHVGPTTTGQRGIFAGRPFAGREQVLAFGGPLLEVDRIRDFTHCIEIASGRFLGPSGRIDDFVNHCCEPNCWVDLTGPIAVLRALRDIHAGEEMTYDYSTLILSDPTRFPCSCGASRCRGEVLPFHRLPPALRAEYVARGIVPRFVLDGEQP